MSSYSNVTPLIVDPVFDRANSRAEYRLPAGNVYLSSFRLINTGISTTDDTTYNPVLGNIGAIRQIQLFDGSQLLDQVTNVPLIASMKHLMARNDTNISMNRFLQDNGLGYAASGDPSFTTDQINQHPPAVDIVNAGLGGKSNMTGGTADQAARGKGWLSLKDMLSFLQHSVIVPSSVYTQLRLVVEYNTPSENKYNLVKTNAAGVSTLAEGLLLVDQVNPGDMADKLMKSYKGVVYYPLEIDRVQLPATGDGADTAAENQIEQRRTYLLNGFNNKMLRRVAIFKQPGDSATYDVTNALQGYGPYASIANWREAVQIRVNGANKLPGRGLASEAKGSGADGGGSVSNRTLAKLVDAWGDYNIVPGFQFCGIAADDTAQALDYSTAVNERVGQQNITGVEVQEKIDEFQLQYERYGVHGNAFFKQAQTLSVIGEVVKAVSMTGQGYNVSYV